MELNRLLRIARARWWVFAVGAGLGLIAAIVLTSWVNGRIVPTFEATAQLAIIPDPGDEANDIETKRLEVLDAALVANQDRVILGSNRIEIAADDTAILNFISSASTVERSAEKADTMRQTLIDTLLEAQDQNISAVQQQQQAIRTRLAQIEEEIRTIEGTRTPEDISTIVDLQRQQLEFTAVANELSARYVERTTGADITVDPLRTDADVELEIAALEIKYREIQTQILERTQVEGNIEFNPIDREIELLRTEYNARINEYGNLVLQEAGAPVQAIGNPDVLDITGTPGSIITNSFAGLIFGLLMAFGLIMVHDRYRQSVWSSSDLRTIPFLGEVAQRAAPLVAGQAWYEFGGPASRKRTIQSMRVTVESATESGSALGFMGIASSAEIHELAADFAMSMVTSGSRVLLIDADFESPSGLFEFSGSGASLSEMLQFRLDDEESYRAFVKRNLTEPPEITEGLTAIHVGHGLADPADAVSGRRLQIVLEEVRRVFDLTVFVAGEAADATALATMNRMNGVIMAIRPGQARMSDVEDVHRQLATFGVPVLGGAMLSRTSGTSIGGPAADPVVEPPSRRRREGSDAQDLLVEALLRERSGAEEAASADGASDPSEAVDGPADNIEGTSDDAYESLRPVDAAPAESGGADLVVVSSLAPSSSADPSEAVASLLSETIEQVLRGFSGSGSGGQRVDPGIAEVTKYGFVPMVRIKGHKTIGARVLDALNAKIESAERSQLITELVSHFAIDEGGRSNERVVTAINDWAREHFFTRHLVDSGREPQVWHISSPQGAFEGLVHVTRCTKERIDLFRSEILRKQIDALNKTMKAASKARRTDQVRMIEEQLKDLRTFDIAWGWLFEGTTPAARLWYPWKGPEAQPQGWDPNFDEGVRANIAPLQRLGVMAQDVLTGEEMLALSPPA